MFDFGNTYFTVGNYQNNLKYYSNCNNCFDIVSVYGWTDSTSSIQLTTDNRELIWERNERETVQMTVGEMKEKLEALIDQNVEIKYEKSQHKYTDTTVQKNELNNYCLAVSCSNCIFRQEECKFYDMNSEQLNRCYERLKEAK